MATPHDDLFHFVFQHVRHAAAWLRHLLPHAIADAIDWASLVLAPDKLRGQALRLSVPDLLFYAERHVTRTPLWIVIEHKAQRDADVETQLLRYVVHLRDRSPVNGSPTPVPVVPVLLHHGASPFAPARVHTNDAIDMLQPRLPFVVDDMRTATDRALRDRPMTALGRLALLCFRNLRGGSDAKALASFEQWADLLRSADHDHGPPSGRDAIAALGWYALRTVEIPPQSLHATFERILQRPEQTIMSTAEKLRREGMEEGLAKGRAETLLQLLTMRFGPLSEVVVESLRSATLQDLERWTDRILDARSLAELFAD